MERWLTRRRAVRPQLKREALGRMKLQHRQPSQLPVLSTRGRVWLGAKVGAAVGMIGLAVGSVRIISFLKALPYGLPSSAPDRGELIRLALLLVGYCGAMTVAGAVAGRLWFLRRSAGGGFLLGYLIAGLVCGAIGLLLTGLDPSASPGSLWPVGITTLIFGTVLGYKFYQDRG